MTQGIIYERFDKVRLTTTRGVMWRSHPAGVTPDVNADWTVSEVLKEGLLLTQLGAVLMIPPGDVRLVSKYDRAWVDRSLSEVLNSKAKGPERG